MAPAIAMSLQAAAAAMVLLAFPVAACAESPSDLTACGSTVDPSTLGAIIRVESNAQILSINVNGAPSQPPPAHSAAEAVAIANTWISRGYSVDLGLMQVNNRNLAGLGFTVADMFEPCTNIRAGTTILTADYLAAVATRPDPQAALKAALSAYNTGSFERGFYNGYVAKYYGPRAVGTAARIVSVAAHHPSTPKVRLNPYTAQPTIFHRSIQDGE